MGDALCGRLQDVVNAIADGNAAEFARRAEIPYRSIQNYLHGQRRPDVDALNKIAHLGVNVHWLLTGDGSRISPMGADVQTEGQLATAVAHRRKSAREILAAAFSKFEEHETGIRDPASQPDYVLDGAAPNRAALLNQFCALYTKYSPTSLGLPEWITNVYPLLTPDDLITAMRLDEEPHVWVQPPKTDWGEWLAAIAELAANGVTPQDVLAKFRPEGFVPHGEPVKIQIDRANGTTHPR